MDISAKKGRVRSSTTNTAPRLDLNFSSVHTTPRGTEPDSATGDGPVGMKRYGALDDLLSSRPTIDELKRTNIIKEGNSITKKLIKDAIEGTKESAQSTIKKNLEKKVRRMSKVSQSVFYLIY
jgi:hypothetical protein